MQSVYQDQQSNGKIHRLPNGKFLLFKKINQNQSRVYQCLAYSEAKISVVISCLTVQVFPVNSTMALITLMFGKHPFITSIRFRDNSTRCMKSIEVNEKTTGVRFLRNVFPDIVELYLLDDKTELVCEHGKKQDSMMYLELFIVFFCFLLCVYSMKYKLKQVDWAVSVMRMRVNLRREPTFYNSSALAVEILTTP